MPGRVPGRNGTPSTSRKRPRAQGTHHADPASLASPSPKKRRLNKEPSTVVTVAACPPAAPKPVVDLTPAATNGLSTTLGHRFLSAIRRSLPGKENAPAPRDAYDVSDGPEDHEQSATPTDTPARLGRPPTKGKHASTKTSTTATTTTRSDGRGAQRHSPVKPPRAVGDVWEVPDSDDDELSAGPAPGKLASISRAKGPPRACPPLEHDAGVAEEKPARRPRGRPPKAKGNETTGTTGTTASKQGRTGRGQDSPGKKAARSASQAQKSGLGTPSTRRGKTAAQASSLLVDVPKLQGILTPQHKGGGGDGRHKTVVFGHPSSEKAGEIFFEDLAPKSSTRTSKTAGPRLDGATPRSGRGKKKATPGAAQQHEVAEPRGASEKQKVHDSDEEVCALCAKPDSVSGNQIVFCDGCDLAVHQKCYRVISIPKGDWFCQDCEKAKREPPALGQLEGEGQTVVTVPALALQKPNIPNFDHHLCVMQRALLARCTGRSRIKLRGQDEAYEKALQLVEQTVAAGEGNSMMVIGARGCGKTTMVESIVSELSARHPSEFHVVRLNGFIHTDDKLALREIWRQLGKEMEVEDELVSKTSSYADILTTLLALLSHPSDLAGAEDGATSRSVIFIIDEFDLFATHARQTLLYNLFDIAQAKKAPIAVLGLTTRIDVVESLEKRVKSRFSHRYVYLGLPKSIPAFWDVCRQGLSIEDEDMKSAGIDVAVKGHQPFWGWWNKRVEDLFQTRRFRDHLEYHFYSTKSVSAFMTGCIQLLAQLSPAWFIPTMEPAMLEGGTSNNTNNNNNSSNNKVLEMPSLEPPDSKLHLLASLSDLDLAMLVAAARLDIVAHTDTVNFAMAYDEYLQLAGRDRAQSGLLAQGHRVWGRGVATMAWERLASLGMLLPAGLGGGGGGRGGGGGGGGTGNSNAEAKMWKLDVALEEIPAAVQLSSGLAKWCREI